MSGHPTGCEDQKHWGEVEQFAKDSSREELEEIIRRTSDVECPSCGFIICTIAFPHLLQRIGEKRARAEV